MQLLPALLHRFLCARRSSEKSGVQWDRARSGEFRQVSAKAFLSLRKHFKSAKVIQAKTAALRLHMPTKAASLQYK
jgi:hypothetical protein